MQRKSLNRVFPWETGSWWQDCLNFLLWARIHNSLIYVILSQHLFWLSLHQASSGFHPLGINHIHTLRFICRIFINSDLHLKSNSYRWLESIWYLLSIIVVILALKVRLRIRTFEQFHANRISSCQPSIPRSWGHGDM